MPSCPKLPSTHAPPPIYPASQCAITSELEKMSVVCSVYSEQTCEQIVAKPLPKIRYTYIFHVAS